MKQSDAFNILGIPGGQNVTPDDIKRAFRRAAQKYHPDRNPAGLEMMKMINAAYDVVRDFSGEVAESKQTDYGDVLNDALNTIISLGLNIEVCGAWVWVTGDTKPHKDILKTSGFSWAPKKLAWYYRPADFKSLSRRTYSLDEIRTKYGSEKVGAKEQKVLAA
jgi:hypothetical protein